MRKTFPAQKDILAESLCLLAQPAHECALRPPPRCVAGCSPLRLGKRSWEMSLISSMITFTTCQPRLSTVNSVLSPKGVLAVSPCHLVQSAPGSGSGALPQRVCWRAGRTLEGSTAQLQHYPSRLAAAPSTEWWDATPCWVSNTCNPPIADVVVVCGVVCGGADEML